MKTFVCVALGISSVTLFAKTFEQRIDLAPLWHGREWQGDWLEKPGYPKIPVVWLHKVLPYGETLKEVEGDLALGDLINNLSLPATPFPVPACQHTPFEETPITFKPGEIYPPSLIGDPVVYEKHGIRIATVPVFGAQYYPIEKRLQKLKEISLVWKTRAASTSPLLRGLDSDKNEITSLVGKDAELATYPQLLAAVTRQYLIIGPSALVEGAAMNSLQKLISSKIAQGISTEILSTQYISTQYAGRDIQEKIRSAIRDYYLRYGVQYVLLVGDGKTSTPARALYSAAYGGSNLYSDYYYACLDGNFDGNGNGRFGEKTDGPNGTEVDLMCEVAVGRFPATTVTELDNAIEKTLRFQSRNLTDPKIKNVMMFGEVLDATTLGSWTMDNLLNGSSIGSITSPGFPKGLNIKKLYELSGSNISESRVISEISTSEPYFINHLGHCNTDYCLKLQNQMISNLGNPMPFALVTQGCFPGNLATDNWAKTLINRPKSGAGLIVANDNYGWYEPGAATGPSSYYHHALSNSLFRRAKTIFGQAHIDAKDQLSREVNQDEFIRWVVYETNLFGDPHTPMLLN